MKKNASCSLQEAFLFLEDTSKIQYPALVFEQFEFVGFHDLVRQ